MGVAERFQPPGPRVRDDDTDGRKKLSNLQRVPQISGLMAGRAR